MSLIKLTSIHSSVTNTVQLLHRFLYVLRGRGQLKCDGKNRRNQTSSISETDESI